jgi:hypothetical protein
MTRLARLAFEDGPRILTKHFGVQRIREMPILRIVTAHAGLLADIRGGLDRCKLGPGSVRAKEREYRGKSECRDNDRQVHGSPGESAHKAG